MMSDRYIDVPGRRFFVREWGPDGGIPVLALHGWRDNCASFDFLAPRLVAGNPALRVVAPDLAGHGKTDFRSPDAAYNIWSDVAELIALVDALEWPRFHLVGHSRGAAIATLIAASHRDRVITLSLLDNFLPLPEDPASAAVQLAKSVVDKRRLLAKTPRYYDDFREAVQARLSGPLALPEDAALALAEQGVASDREGYYWRLDARLLGASEFKLSRDHIAGIVAGLKCPVEILLGRESTLGHHDYVRRLAAGYDHIRVSVLPGGHHLHMDHGLVHVTDAILATLARDQSRSTGIPR